MHAIFTLARIYPFWAVPVSVISFELGRSFGRKNKSIQYCFWAVSAILVFGLLIWLIYRGDLNSDDWVRSFQ